MVIIVWCDELEIKRVLVDQGSYVDILYWDAFEKLLLNLEDLRPFKGSLVGYYEEQVKVKGCIMLKTTFGERDQAREFKVSYHLVHYVFVFEVPAPWRVSWSHQRDEEISKKC